MSTSLGMEVNVCDPSHLKDWDRRIAEDKEFVNSLEKEQTLFLKNEGMDKIWT